MSERRRVQSSVCDRSGLPRVAHRRRSRIAPVLSAISLITLTSVTTVAAVTTVASVGTSPAAAIPGTPGVPQAPTVAFTEDFENNVSTSPILLTNYVGALGDTYTADPAWLTNCNGVIVVPNSPDSDMGQSGCRLLVDYSTVRQLAYAAGVAMGAADPATNHAVTAFTEGNPGANKVQFQTVNPIPLMASNRFLTFSVAASETSCTSNHALFEFYLLNGASQIPTFTTPIDPCSSPLAKSVSVPKIGNSGAGTMMAGVFPSNSSVLFSGSSVGIKMVNAQGSGAGNDAAFDDIQILDVTPQLDKSFAPTTVPQGGTSALTFTVTNTTDLAAKNGWSFSDALPPGLTLAASPAPSTTCPAGVVNAPAGASTVSMTGNLSAGMPSCTVTVTVTSAVAATYTNGPANMTVAGLNPPGSSSVTFIPAEDLHISKAASPDPFVPGQALTYKVVVTNSGPSAADGAVVSDPLPAALAGAGFTWTCTASAGSTCTASGTGNIDDTVDVAVDGTLTYTVTGTVPSSVQSTLTNTATLTPPANSSDPDCDPDCTATATTAANPTLGLSVSKTSTPDPYVPGANLTYTVTVANSGPSDAVGAGVSDPLPVALAGHGFTWTCTPSAGSSCTASGSGDIVDTVDIPAGGSVVYTITGTVPSSTTGALINTAVATPPPGTTAPTCTPSCSGSNSSPPGPAVALSIAKSASPDPYVPGDTLSYTVTVSNAGPSDALGATVEDPLPLQLAGDGFTWTCRPSAGSTCSASGSGDIDDTVSVTSDGDVVYTVTGTVPSSVQSTLTNTATVTPPQGDTDSGCTPDCSATTATAAAPLVSLSVTKSASPDPYVPGQSLTYSITVSNAGPSDAIAAGVDDSLPAPLAGAGFTWTCHPSTASSSCTPTGSGDIVDTVTVAAGGSVTYSVTGIVPPSSSAALINTATASPPPGTTDPGCSPNCSASATTAADPVVGLSIEKASTPDPYVPGLALTYTVTVTNVGPSDAPGATVADPLPASLSHFTWTCTATAGSTCSASGHGDIERHRRRSLRRSARLHHQWHRARLVHRHLGQHRHRHRTGWDDRHGVHTRLHRHQHQPVGPGRVPTRHQDGQSRPLHAGPAPHLHADRHQRRTLRRCGPGGV